MSVRRERLSCAQRKKKKFHRDRITHKRMFCSRRFVRKRNMGKISRREESHFFIAKEERRIMREADFREGRKL